MAKDIKVTVKGQNVKPESAKVDMLVLGLFSDIRKDKLCESLDKKLGGAIAKIKRIGDFNGKLNSTTVLYTDGKIGAKRLMLLGLGESKKITFDKLRKAASCAAYQAVTKKIKSIALAVHQADGKYNLTEAAAALTEGAYFGSYRYDEFVTKKAESRLESLNVVIVEANEAKLGRIKKGIRSGGIVGRAQSYARTIANRPGNIVYPATLAAEAKKIARSRAQLSCTVLNEKQIEAKGMGGILAVGSGSVRKPRLIILKYTPSGKTNKTIGLVGKAVTFDSGGISIKPSANMDQMKFDKSGGIAVLAAMEAISQLKPKVKVYGIIPSAENMPSATSYRPGDIIKTYSGKTVEVQNTDAEGRMILCDAIHYAVQQKCDYIVDIATLTGACMVALGKYKAGVMSNDDGLVKRLKNASEQSGEPIWHMPSGEEYLAEMKSKIADLKNIGSRWGGACTAAAFLGEFVGKNKWAHIDMAGVDLFENGKQFSMAGSSGFGVRLLTQFVMNFVAKK